MTPFRTPRDLPRRDQYSGPLILERKRDLALLRVLGMSIAEVRRMLVLESSVLGLTSRAAGLTMGYVLSWISSWT